jgi:hypothetical protein
MLRSKLLCKKAEDTLIQGFVTNIHSSGAFGNEALDKFKISEFVHAHVGKDLYAGLLRPSNQRVPYLSHSPEMQGTWEGG